MIGFAGLSHLGLVSAAAAAAKGFDVVGFDEDAGLIEELRGGRLPVVEPGLPELLESHGARLSFTSDPGAFAGCELVYVSVDVPTADDGTGDPEPVVRFLDVAADAARPGACVVVLSQVEPGFTRTRRDMVERDGRTLCYQVETLIFGRAVERALEPERFIIGCADPAEPLPVALASYLEAFGCPILPMRFESAELSKIAINAFLVSTISTTNTLAELCENVGGDWAEIAPALRLDRRIGEHAYLAPGLGIGGSNLLRDMATIERLAGERGSDASIVGSWRAHAAHRATWLLDVLRERLLSKEASPRIALWGLSYKEETQSTRNSPGLQLARSLEAARIHVAAYDPAAEPVEMSPDYFRRLDEPLSACDGAHALVVATPWSVFSQADPAAIAKRMAGKLVVDPYGVLDADACAAVGLERARLGLGVTG